MFRMAVVFACTVALAGAGFWVGSAVHGSAPAAVVPVAAGAAGGFGIGCALLDVARRARSSRARRA